MNQRSNCHTCFTDVLTDLNKTTLDYPATPLRFRTFPDPRLPGGSRFRFVVSSCTTPNFPYTPFGGRRIKGWELMADYLAEQDKSLSPPPASKPEAADPVPIPEPETTTEEATETESVEAAETPSINDTEAAPHVEVVSGPATVSETDAVGKSRVEFGLFLGDFIYADVPMYFGDDSESYRRLYRRNYQSTGFRKVYERLRKSTRYLLTTL